MLRKYIDAIITSPRLISDSFFPLTIAEKELSSLLYLQYLTFEQVVYYLIGRVQLLIPR